MGGPLNPPPEPPRIRRALDAADKALLDEEEAQPVAEDQGPSIVDRMRERAQVQEGALGDLKDWQIEAVPPDLAIPKDEEVTVMRFKAHHCKSTAQHKGDRTVVIWSLSVGDERAARQRMFGDATRGLEEMAKGMIRAIDGRPVSKADPTVVERFWDEIGPRHRGMIVAWYQRTHNFDDAERLLFFAECVAVRTAR